MYNQDSKSRLESSQGLVARVQGYYGIIPCEPVVRIVATVELAQLFQPPWLLGPASGLKRLVACGIVHVG